MFRFGPQSCPWCRDSMAFCVVMRPSLPTALLCIECGHYLTLNTQHSLFCHDHGLCSAYRAAADAAYTPGELTYA